VSESLDLPRHTVPALLEVLEGVFRSEDKPSRVLYTRGEPLLVERNVLVPEEGEDFFLTPYEMVRQHADLEIWPESGGDRSPVLNVLHAVQSLRNNTDLTFLVCSSRRGLDGWIANGASDPIVIGKTLGVSVLEDPDCPPGCVFICGSRRSSMIRDVEYSIMVRME